MARLGKVSVASECKDKPFWCIRSNIEFGVPDIEVFPTTSEKMRGYGTPRSHDTGKDMQPTWFVGPNIVCFLYDGIASVVYGTCLDDYLLYRLPQRQRFSGPENIDKRKFFFDIYLGFIS